MTALGRRVPTDWKHVEAHPLTAATLPAEPTAVVLGINWYTKFFKESLVKRSDGRWWIPETNLGQVEGGHAICVKPGTYTDPIAWWEFYDQGNEGSCVGFSLSRMSSLHNRTRYGGRWLYQEAQKIDEWPGTNYEGTSVRAGFDILHTRGHRRLIGGVLGVERPPDGIAAFRWAQSVDEVHQTIRMPLADSLGAVPLLNSWGRDDYPHITWLPDIVLDRLLSEDGEAGLVTDL